MIFGGDKAERRETLMAGIIKRIWRSGPRRVKRVAWGYTLQLNGKQERRFNVAWSKDDAREALAARILERDKRREPPPDTITLGAMAEKYLLHKEAARKRSIRNDRMALARLTSALGAETALAHVTAARIAEYAAKRLTETSKRLGRPVAPASVNRDLSVLRGLLRLAKRWRYLTEVPEVEMAREPEGRLRFLSEEEAVRLLDECRKAGEHRVSSCRSPHLLPVVTVALNTGMRKSEILGLTWERVDFARGVIQLERTKNDRRREVPMNRAVYDALSVVKGADQTGPVFRKLNGAAWGSVRTAFARAVEDARIDNFRFHDLRHTFASWLVMRGRSLKEVQELLGHSSLTMTMRYAHLSPDRLREAVMALDNFSTTSAHNPATAEISLVSTRQN